MVVLRSVFFIKNIIYVRIKCICIKWYMLEFKYIYFWRFLWLYFLIFFFGSYVNFEKNDLCVVCVDFLFVLFLVVIMDIYFVKFLKDLIIFFSILYVGILLYFYLNKSLCWLIWMLKFINVFFFRIYKNWYDFFVEEIL